MSARSGRIGLLDHMGGGNLGDDATQTAVIQYLRSHWPRAEICGFSMNPEDTQRRHGIPSYPIRQKSWSLGASSEGDTPTFNARLKTALRGHPRIVKCLQRVNRMAIKPVETAVKEALFLMRALRIMRSMEVLVVNGGGQLTDNWGGAWGFPYTLFKWFWIARLAGARNVVLNVGAGPLNRRMSRWFVRRTLKAAEYTSFRDEESRDLVRRIKFRGRTRTSRDSVYGLEVGPRPAASSDGARLAKVGISPMAYGNPQVYREHNPNVYEVYIRNLAEAGLWLTRNGYRLTLFCSDIGVDPAAMDDFEALLEEAGGREEQRQVSRAKVSTTTELLESIASTDYVITSRFHGVVFAHLLNKPVIAISHHPKVDKLMSDLGLSTFCVDIKSCDVEVLKEKFTMLVQFREAIQRQMAEKLASYREELHEQFNEVFSQLLGPAEAGGETERRS